jgi:hypothetical protein
LELSLGRAQPIFSVIGFLIWERGLARRFPAFFALTIIGGLGGLAVFGADIAPFVSAPSCWFLSFIVVLLVALVKFLVIGEDLSKLLVPYPSVSRLGRTLVDGFGAVLILLPVMAMALAKNRCG